MGKRFRSVPLRRAGATSALVCLIVAGVLSGCSAPRLVSTGTTLAKSTTTAASPTAATATPSATPGTTATPPTAATPPTPGTIVPPSTPSPAISYVTLHWLDASFAAPSGWSVSAPIRQKPQAGCVHPAVASPGAPSWIGCSGIWVIPWTSDPTKPGPGDATPGQVWFMSSGALPCPYPSSNPEDVVLDPGTLVDRGDRSVGGVTYHWSEWSATCNLNGTPGAPVTHTFDVQVWWLPSAGIAFFDVADQPQITEILDTVHRYVPPPTTTTTTTPPASIDFHSPTGNIHCAIRTGGAPASDLVHCFTLVPAQSVTLLPNGTYTTCSGASCLAAPGAAEIDLTYGQAVGRGPFNCTSTFNGTICTAADGRGFEISRSGVAPA